MAMVAVVLLVIFSIICVINYQQAVADVYATLESAIDHDTMPKKEPLASAIPPATSDRSGESSAEADDRMPFEIGGKGASFPLPYTRSNRAGRLLRSPTPQPPP